MCGRGVLQGELGADAGGAFGPGFGFEGGVEGEFDVCALFVFASLFRFLHSIFVCLFVGFCFVRWR